MPETFEGFIVHAYFPKDKKSARLYLIGRLKGGETFAVVEERQRPGFYIRKSELKPAQSIVSVNGIKYEDCNFTALDGEASVRLTWDRVSQFQQAYQELTERGIRTYEGDMRFTDQYLMSRGIHGSVTIEGKPLRGRRVNWIFKNPQLSPADWQPSLSVLSIDIETNPYEGAIYAISLAQRDPFSGERQEVLFAGDLEGERQITAYPDEKSMLQAFCERVVAWDPDIVTGWNVIDFDFNVIASRISHHGLSFQIGRSDVPAAFLPGEKGRSNTVIVPGRQVIDAVRLVRAGPSRYSDYTLETVALAELGRGKVLEQKKSENKLEAIVRLYRDDPVSLCRYCLEDSLLVLDILEKTGLVELTVRRCLLIGISLDRAWTSIHAFDYLYIEALHNRGYVAPSTGVDALPSVDAPGGAILEPQTGLFENVWVFDFKSLYPTIIRTFNIDPLSFVLPGKAAQLPEEEQARLIKAPNGSCFRRDPAILPELLERFFQNRDIAKEQGDEVASHVYKIIMNSFYGVLGVRGYRFASGLVSGAITSFGQHFLSWCRDYINGMGYRVLYGDTDSLFVLSGLPRETSRETLQSASGELCERINSSLKRYIEESYGVHSWLELEFEKIYFRFFLPPVRTAAASEVHGARGRAKGYAGLLLPVDEIVSSNSEKGKWDCIEVRGMEAVRRDWTDLAKGFQIGLLMLVFREAAPDEIRTFIRSIITDLYDGKLDESLVYRKFLRKPVSKYTRVKPPHVRAAAMLDAGEQRGLIHYVWTLEGPQPLEKLNSAPDYQHYVDKQLRPIAQSFAEVLHVELDRLFGGEGQLELF